MSEFELKFLDTDPSKRNPFGLSRSGAPPMVGDEYGFVEIELKEGPGTQMNLGRHPDSGNMITEGSRRQGDFYSESAVRERGLIRGKLTKPMEVPATGFSDN